jgi:hypothetical protein
MTRWTGAAVLALALMSDGAVAIYPAAAAPLQSAEQKPQMSKTTKSQRAASRAASTHYVDRTDDRFYYDRPTTYRPYPYVSPVPFFLGFGFGP